MKPFITFFFCTALLCTLSAQELEKPDWVRLVQLGKTLPDTLDSYFGIGASTLSQADADARAREEFAFNIEARVQNVISRSVQETDNVLKDEYSASAKVSSDVVLRGIRVSARYEDRDVKLFYALIQIQKSVFDTLLVTEIRRDLERKKAENKIKEAQRAEDLRSRQAELDLARKEQETREQEIELERKQYEDFLKLSPPEQVIDLRNGEIARNGCTLALKAGLTPFEIQSAFAVLALSRFELSANTYFQSDKVLKGGADIMTRQQAALKVQLLDQAGQFYKASLAFGVVGYANAARFSAFDSVKPTYSVFVSGDVGLPTFLYSFASFNVDGRKISFGVNSFPMPGYLKDAVSVLFQVDYVWNKDWRDRFSDPLLFQSGVRFRASEAFSTSFTYEGHEFLVFTVEMGL